MCWNAAGIMADKALKAAQAEWELVCAINTEGRDHKEAVAAARKLLVERGDVIALDIFDAVRGRQPDLEKARALVER